MGNTEQPRLAELLRHALRGRDPFYDDDKTAQLRFAQLAAALFTALEDASPLDPAVLA